MAAVLQQGTKPSAVQTQHSVVGKEETRMERAEREEQTQLQQAVRPAPAPAPTCAPAPAPALAPARAPAPPRCRQCTLHSRPALAPPAAVIPLGQYSAAAAPGPAGDSALPQRPRYGGQLHGPGASRVQGPGSRLRVQGPGLHQYWRSIASLLTLFCCAYKV